MDSRSSSSSVSMVSAERRSSEAVGSSRSRMSGSSANVRARHILCCCPPEKPEAASLRRSLTSSQRPARRRLCSMRSSASRFPMPSVSSSGSVMFLRSESGRGFGT